MNRREILSGATLLGGAAAVGAAAQGAGRLGRDSRRMKVVVTGGHPGDPEYGCGGMIRKLVDLGHEVVLLYLNDGAWQETSAALRIGEAKKACEILGARPVYANQLNGHAVVNGEKYREFQELLESHNPDAVFTHWMIDNHADHRAIANLTYEAWKELKRKFALFYYEVSDGDDTMQFPVPTHYVDISQAAGVKKNACYAHASQSPDYFYPLQDKVALFRGLQAGCERAEAYALQQRSPGDFFQQAGLPAQ